MKLNPSKSSKIMKVWGDLATSIEGLPIAILKSSSKELKGVRGTVINETANMIRIQTSQKNLFIQKNGNVFELEFADGSKYIINGEILQGMPDTRIKKRMLSW